MAIDKNFVVKHGLEVNTDLILANADISKVGIATTNPQYTLHVNGGIGVTDAYVSGIATFATNLVIDGTLTANASVGSTGQYLRSTTTGVEWATLPNVRTSTFFTATAGQTGFSFSYTVGLLDVFVNGVKLDNSEVTATDGITVNLNNPCFGGEVVEIIGYSTIGLGVGGTGIAGITVLEEGSVTGNIAAVNSINFVGASVTAVGTGAGVTVYITEGTGTGSTSPWITTTAGIHTLSNVGIATTNPRFALEVGAVGASGTSLWVNGNARVTGILTVGTSSIILDGSSNTINVGTGVTIEGNSGVLKASGAEVGIITANTIIYAGSTLENLWVSNATGIHTTSNVGIGTTNAEKPLTVFGDIKVTGGGDVIIDEDSAIFFDASDLSSPYIEYQNNTQKGFQIVNGTGYDTFVVVGSGNTFYIQEDVLSSYTPNRIASFDYTNGINFYKRLNVSGIVSATQFIGAASSVTVLANNSSATTHYVGFFTNTTGSNNILSDSTLQYVPSTNTLTAGTFDGNVSADNITSGTLSNSRLPSSISLSGIITASAFVGDGSGITGVVAVGSGLEFRDKDITVGTASTLNVGIGLSLSQIVNGITTISGFSGDYNDLTNQPSIPTDTGDLTNSVGFITSYTETSTLNDILDRGNISGIGISVGVVTATSFAGDGSNVTGISTLNIVDYGVGLGGGGGGGGESYWSQTDVGIHTLSNVGIGTTQPTATLDVNGTLNVSGVSTFAELLDANGGLDVIGHSELDNANISGFLTATDAYFSGNVSIAGTLTYEDVTNIDAIGLVTARSGVIITNGGLNVTGISTFSNQVTIFNSSPSLKLQDSDGTEQWSDLNFDGSAGFLNLDLRRYFNSSGFRIRSFAGGVAGATFLTVQGGATTDPTFGFIGINSTTPSARLDVVGDAKVSGNLNVAGVSTVGILTGATYYGNASNVVDGRWEMTGDGSDYTFTGIGITSGNNTDPVLYLARGRVYEFVNNAGGSHPFEIRESSGGSAYTAGVTGSSIGTTRFEVPMNAPNTLFYQCTIHAGMGNTISVYPSLI